MSSSILVAALFYSIIKHRLFDLRLVVARSLGYALSLAALAGIYVLVAYFIFSRLFFPEQNLEPTQEVYFALAAVIIAATFQPLKRFFDKVTNRLFYRDAYDSQALIERLNRLLVTNIDIDALLKKSAMLIEENIKAEFCFFSLKETAYMPRRMVGDVRKKFHTEDLATIADLGSKTKERVLVTDELDETHAELRDKLNHYSIAMLARLSTSPKHDQEGTGFLILGHKKSGNPYNSQDVKVIGIIANEMVIAIQNSLRFEEIEKFTITLQEKVDDATKKLRQTNEKLKTIDETKDEFISMASHQLRTPLTSVKGYLSMVLEGDAGELNEMQSRLLNQAFISSQRMVYLIADLLNVSRLRTGRFVIEPKPTNLADVVQGEVEQLIDTAASRGIELKYDKPEDFPVLQLDENKLRQVIMNFTDNAIYYTPSGGHIEVALEDKGDTIEFTVTDDGMGVPKAEQQHLFNKFYRAANARQARPDGTGLGLFMSKKIIIAQGGEVIFNSTENKGSTFGFSFNKAKLAKLAPETLPAEN